MQRVSSFYLALPGLLLAACASNGTRDGSDGDELGISTDAGHASESSGSTGEGDGDQLPEPDLPPTCEPECDDHQQCIGGVCCDELSACAGLCCGAGEVCSFAECVVPGDECIDASECPDNYYCEYSLGDLGGVRDQCQGTTIATGKCLPSPPDCPPGVEPDPSEELTCLPQCEYHPKTSFAPTLKFHLPELDIMMAPVVIQLDDDTCDGIVDERDIPEIVFSSFVNNYNSNGTLHAVSIIDGAVVEKWAVMPQGPPLHPGVEIAAGDVGGMKGAEIFTCTTDGRVRAYNPNGSERWMSEYSSGCLMPSLADLDHDGQVEVVVKGGVLDALTGQTRASFGIVQNTVQAIDVDGDGVLEIVGPQAIYAADGTLLAETGLSGSWTAAADLDLDLRPEIIVVDFDTHRMHIYHWDPARRRVVVDRQNLDINGPLSPELCPADSLGRTRGGGPPTVADFNGDGTPDVAIAGGVGYAVFDGTRVMNPLIRDRDTFLWISQTHDCSSAQTGSSVFDFDGDGAAEVVYSDEHYLRIYAGSTGAVLWQTCNTTGTLREQPVIADVDNDGHADIVVVSNAYPDITCRGTQQRGLRVFGDALGLWVRTRRVWNQHHYHVTNVEEDGRIPRQQQANWLARGLNNFRQNVQPLGEFSAPDLVVDLRARCMGGYQAIATVRNIGQAAVPPGIIVGFYDGDPSLGGDRLGSGRTTKTLYPAEAQDLILDGADVPQAIQDGDAELWVVVDDGMPEHPWHECRTDNNVHHEELGCNLVG